MFDAARLGLNGVGFRGISGASGGNGTQDSSSGYPLVQLRRLDSGESRFLLPDSTTSFSNTNFTSVPLGNLPLGHYGVTVIANGIPSPAFTINVPFADIGVLRDSATGLLDGATLDLGFTTVPLTLNFTIRSAGTLPLTGIGFSKDGPNAAEFSITTGPATSVPGGGSTTFSLQFTPATPGPKSAAIHIANNVPGKNPYDINLTVTALSFAIDTDGDGLNDGSEYQLSALGFDWQVSQPALVQTLLTNLSGVGFYTIDQIQALNVDVPLLARDPPSGQFKLTIGVQKATDLSLPFLDFPMSGPGTSTLINGQGKLEFLFTAPDNAAFFRLESR